MRAQQYQHAQPSHAPYQPSPRSLEHLASEMNQGRTHQQQQAHLQQQRAQQQEALAIEQHMAQLELEHQRNRNASMYDNRPVKPYIPSTADIFDPNKEVTHAQYHNYLAFHPEGQAMYKTQTDDMVEDAAAKRLHAQQQEYARGRAGPIVNGYPSATVVPQLPPQYGGWAPQQRFYY
jgi:hypothetical protein